jgi:flagellar FliL protein
MANKEKAPKKAPAEEPKGDSSSSQAPSEVQKKGNLILILLIVGAMVVGGIGAFLAMKLLSAKSPETETVSTEESAPPLEPSSSPSAEGNDPIVAPSKSGRGGGAAPSGGHSSSAEGGATAEGAVPEGPAVVKLDPFTTNLNASGGRAFIKLTMSFEMDSQEGVNQVTGKMDDIRDTIITLLMGVSADDISTPDGILRLKTQIQSRVNNLLPDYKVRKVNITDIAIQ